MEIAHYDMQGDTDIVKKNMTQRFREACERGNKELGTSNRFVTKVYDNELFIVDTRSNTRYTGIRDFDQALERFKTQLRKKLIDRRNLKHDDFIDLSEEDLNHYGVLGMKWGIHKDPQRAYERANKKLAALDEKATKAGAKAARKETRSLRRQQRADTAWLFPKTKAKLADWAIGRSEKHRQKYVKKMSRAVSWYKEMENAFRDTKIENLNQDYVALGEKYSKIQVNDLMMNAQASLANKQLRMIYRQMGR